MTEKTLLIIENDEDTRERIKELISDKPARIVEIDKAADAVVAVMTEMPDIIVMSLEMPDGDGIGTLKNIRIMNHEVPIICLVKTPTKEMVIEAKKARVQDFLLKPPNFERLNAKIIGGLWPVDGNGEEVVEEEAPAPEPEPFIEAIPKGAEVLNINDTITGMKIARTLVFNDVVFADKGQVLTEAMLKQLNRMGVAEVCVYINPELKRMAAERKKRMLQQRAIKVEQQTTAKGGKIFTTVKRDAVRVPTDITCKLTYTDKEKNAVETECNLVDISAGGCAILTAKKLDKDQQIFMTFKLGDLEMKSLRGVVRHCVTRGAKPPKLPMRSGIYFDSITERFREDLYNVIFKIQREMMKKGIPTYIE